MGEIVIINKRKILGILLASMILGIIVNHFSPLGIPLIRKKVELGWASDSLLFDLNRDSVVVSADSIGTLQDISIIENESENSKETAIKEKLETTKGEETNKPEKEVIKFSEPKTVTLEQAYKLSNNGVIFVDARDEADFLAGHITGSINIPFDDFDNHKQKLDKLYKEKPMVIYCAGTDCDLSILLGNLLFEQGYKQIYIFFGGWIEWQKANYPIDYPSE